MFYVLWDLKEGGCWLVENEFFVVFLWDFFRILSFFLNINKLMNRILEIYENVNFVGKRLILFELMFDLIWYFNFYIKVFRNRGIWWYRKENDCLD